MKFGFEGSPRQSPGEEKGTPDLPEEASPLLELQSVADQLVERASQLPQPEPAPKEEEFDFTPADDLGDTVRSLRKDT